MKQFIFLTILLIICSNSYAQEVGVASFYTLKSSSNITASGERYDENALTCASMDYPFGTILKIVNIANGKLVLVKVTDRGGFKKYGRIIDLSKEAFRRIADLKEGLIRVQITEWR